MLNRLSVKSKLVIIMLLVGLCSALLVGYLGWRTGQNSLQTSILNGSVTIRKEKAAQIEAYFRNMRNQVEILSQNDMVVEASVRFNRAFQQLQDEMPLAEWDKGLETYYTEQFFPKLFANLPGQAEYALYRPESQAGLYLQYQYIAANPHPDGEKFVLDQADDGSSYSEVHAYYHPRLLEMVKKFGYDDLIFVNYQTGDVVYSISKQTDFASNLDNGPYRNTNEAEVLRKVRTNPDRGTAQLVDFELYRPNYGAPAAFWGAPIYNGPHLVGVLLIQISIAEIDRIMTYSQNWEYAGLGKTGETYLVGSDLTMRSNSRFLIEAPDSYKELLKTLGTPDRTIQLIGKFGTSILFQHVSAASSQAAIQNQEGILLGDDYRRVPVLASYQPLQIEGLQWGLINKMDQAEALAPVRDLERQLLISVVLLMVLLAFAAALTGWWFMRPVNTLIEGTRQVSAGKYDVAVKIATKDEIGTLANSFNGMVQNIRQQTNLLEQKNREIERLLLNLLPSAAARRVLKGEKRIIDQVQQVSVVYASVLGFQELVKSKEAQEIADILQDLSIDVDEAAVRYDIDRLTTTGQRFIAACGLSAQYLDHSRRAAEFGLAVLRTVQRLNRKYNINLNLRMGIHSGTIMAGVIGVNKMIYEMWGETVNIASYLNDDAGPNTILVSQEVYERIQDQYVFQRSKQPYRDQPRPVAWVLERAVRGETVKG